MRGGVVRGGRAGVCVRAVGGSRAGGVRVTLCLRNARVACRVMVASAGVRLSGVVAGRHILAIQDTTSLRDDGDQNSLMLHAMIAVDAASATCRVAPVLCVPAGRVGAWAGEGRLRPPPHATPAAMTAILLGPALLLFGTALFKWVVYER